MRRLIALWAIVSLPVVAGAQTINLTPTNSSWTVKCTAMSAQAQALNRSECDGTFKSAKQVNANPGGWASDPLSTPQGNAFYISPTQSGSLWSNTPNENEHFSYVFRTTFDLTGYIANTASLSLNTFWFDNYWHGFALNGVFTRFSDIGNANFSGNNDPFIDPDPRLPNGSNWTRNHTLTIPTGGNFVNGVNSFDLVISGNGRTDGILASGVVNASVVPEPATLSLIGAGLVGLVGAARRRRTSTAA